MIAYCFGVLKVCCIVWFVVCFGAVIDWVYRVFWSDRLLDLCTHFHIILEEVVWLITFIFCIDYCIDVGRGENELFITLVWSLFSYLSLWCSLSHDYLSG